MVKYGERTPKELTTEVSEFERIVRIGLGRAITVLNSTDPRLYRNVILGACLNDLGFDTQIEGGRAQYVFDLINLSGELAFYRAQVLSALKTETEYYNLRQLFELAQMFAEQGYDEARQEMYARFAANAVDTTLDLDISQAGAEEIIHLDGIRGLLFVAGKLGERATSDADYWDDGVLLRVAEEQVGTEAVYREMEQARLHSGRIEAYLRTVEEVERNRERLNREDFTKLSYIELRRRIDDFIGEFNVRATQWGRFAGEDAIERAAQDLLSEEDPTRLYAYLRIFWKRPFPLGPEHLIDLAHSEDNKLMTGALNALRNVRHLLVRQLALSLMNDPSRAYLAVDLLEKNYEPGDHIWIDRALEGASSLADENIYHWLGFGILQVYEANPILDATPALVTLYENGPCSKCRERCFDLLRELNALPEWMVEECLHDANLDLREKTASLKQ